MLTKVVKIENCKLLKVVEEIKSKQMQITQCAKLEDVVGYIKRSNDASSLAMIFFLLTTFTNHRFNWLIFSGDFLRVTADRFAAAFTDLVELILALITCRPLFLS